MIRSITIQGFKAIWKETIELGHLNVFVGANGAGKSAVLEAIGVLGAAADGRVDDASLLRRGVRPGVPRLYKSTFADKNVPRFIRISATSDDRPSAIYAVSLDNPIERAGDPWRFSNERLAHGGRRIVTRGPRGATLWRAKGKSRSFKPGDATRGVARTPSPFGPPPAAVNSLLDTLADFTIFDPQTPVLRGTEADQLPRDPVGVHGGRLAEAIQAIQSRSRFGEMPEGDLYALLDWARRLDIAAPTTDLISPSIPAATEIVRFADRFMKRGRDTLSGYDASEGALYVLFALTLLFHPRVPRFFALENIDHALHHRLARALVGTIQKYVRSSKRQVLLTTHNPLVLDSLDLADEAFRLFTVERDTTGHARVRRIEYSEAIAKARESDLTLSRMWTQGLLGAVPNLS